MRSTMKKVINICTLLSCVLVLLTQIQVKAAGSDTPILQIESYSIDEGALTPGGTITVNLSVTNTSTSVKVTDAVLTMNVASGYVYPVYGEDNQIVLGSIPAGGTVDTSIQLNVSKYFKDEAVAVECDFTYLAAGNIAKNQVMLAIPSTTGYSLNISKVKVAERATVGAKSLINFEITNISANEIKNAVLLVSGNVAEETKRIEIGTISANKQYLKDYYVLFDSAGEQTIRLTLNYTDSNGAIISIDQGSYTVHIDNVAASETIHNGNSAIGIVGYMIAGVAGIIVLIIMIFYMKKHI